MKITFKELLESNNKNNMVKNISKVSKIFKKLKIEYMFIGKGSAIIQGFPDTTQDIDIYPKNEIENNKKIVKALKKLKFNINEKTETEILRGKDFIQFTEPFEFDLVFAPDGFEDYDNAKKYLTWNDGLPLLNIAGIIKSKKAAGRKKDLMSIDELEDFLRYVDS